MKIRIRSVTRRGAVVIAVVVALAALAASAVSANAAIGSVSQDPPQPHSPPRSCIRAAILAYQDRHLFVDSAHLDRALRAALAHRHAACPEVVDYLRQSEA
jgi:hypothetical protein